MNCIKCKKEIENDSVYCRFCGKKLVETQRPKTMKRANGMGGVTKLQGRRKKPWMARLTTVDASKKRNTQIIGYYERKTDALLALEKVVNNGGLPKFFNITVEEVRELWMKKHYPQISESGVQNYNTAWSHFDESVKKMKMSEVKTYHFQAIVDDAASKGLSRSTCEKIKQLASQLCKWALENDVINRNYAQFIEIKAKESVPREPFTVKEMKTVWDYYERSGDLTAGVILLLCHTGLRMDELLSMKKEDYYNGCLHGGSKTEKGMNRSVPVPDIMISIMDKLMKEPGEYLISNANGNKTDRKNWRERKYYKALEAAGFSEELRKRRTPHSCRHTYATMCARAKMDDKALQDILGHEDISTTKNIYAHTDEEYLKAAAKDLNFLK